MLKEASLEGQDTDSSRHCFVESCVCGLARISLDDSQDGQIGCPPGNPKEGKFL